MKTIIGIALLALFSTVTVSAEQPGEAAMNALDRDTIVELVSEKTAECRKEKDDSMCSNYFSEDGIIKRVMHEDGERRDGRWFIDDQDRLCILWDGKIKPLCFAVIEQADGSYNLIKNDEHITTITGIADGNTRGM